MSNNVDYVEPDGYCQRYYADVGAFGHKRDGSVIENLTLLGDKFNFSMSDVKEFTNDVRTRLQRIVK